jgi:hypothetical protein
MISGGFAAKVVKLMLLGLSLAGTASRLWKNPNARFTL